MRTRSLFWALSLSVVVFTGCRGSDGTSGETGTDWSEETSDEDDFTDTAGQCVDAETMPSATSVRLVSAAGDTTTTPFVATDGESLFANLFVDGKEGLYRLSWDGTTKTLLSETTGESQVLGKDSVFVDTRDGILKVKKDGSGAELFSVGSLFYIDGMAADNTNVYASEGSSFYDCAGSGSDPIVAVDQETGRETVLAVDLCGPHNLVSDGEFLYFTTKPVIDESDEMHYSEVLLFQRVPVTGGTPEVLATIENAFGLAVSNGWLYTRLDTEPDITQVDEALLRLPSDGGSEELNSDCLNWGVTPIATDTGVLTMYADKLDFVDATDNTHHLMETDANLMTGNAVVHGNSLFIAGGNYSLTRYDFEPYK